MPNGKHNPQCHNCDFHHPPAEAEPTDRRWCHKHDFVMPRVGGELICTDWQHNNEKAEVFTSPLESGFLYYYSYASSNPPEKLKDFQSLQAPIIGSTIHKDKRFGWVLYVKESQYQYFPEPQEKLRIRLNKTEYEFKLVDARRKLWAESNLTPSGQWDHHYETKAQRMIYCPKSRKALYEWLNTYIAIKDVVAYQQAHEHAVSLLALGFFAFVELAEEKRLYVLRPDLFMYRDYRRSGVATL